MRKNSWAHSSQLPNKVAHWQNNFTVMKHKAIDYLKKHNHQEMHPIADAQHQLILNNNHKDYSNKDSLFCNKLSKEQVINHHELTPRAKKLELWKDQIEHKVDSSNIFKNKSRVSSQGGSGHAYQDDFIRVLPPICSLQLERQQKRQEDHHEYTLKQKLQTYNKLSNNKQQENRKQQTNSRRRFRSIEQSRNRQTEINKAPRSTSTFYRLIGKYQKIKTQAEKKDIFFIPVAQYLKEHQKTINYLPLSTAKSSKKSQVGNQQTQMKVEDVSNRQKTNVENQKLPEENIFTPLSQGQYKKQLHTNTHKRVYAHVKQHRHDTKVLQKQTFQNFMCSPWQNISQQATITNLDVVNSEKS